jgi:hypothetical protein
VRKLCHPHRIVNQEVDGAARLRSIELNSSWSSSPAT